jgi:hypothetical protein
MVLMRVQRRRFDRVVVGLCAAVGAFWLAMSPAGAVSLPDGRAYEAVTPVATEGNATAYIPSPGFIFLSRFGEHGIVSGQAFRVANDGEAVVYAGDPPPTGGSGSRGDVYQATHLPGGGWGTVDIQPGNVQAAEYEAFSSDLSTGILKSPQALTAAAPSGYTDLYARASATGDYHQFFSETPPYLSPNEFYGGLVFVGGNSGTGDVPAMSHLQFVAGDALLEGEGQLEGELREDVKKESEEGKSGEILYDSIAGRLSLVSVLPDGKADTKVSYARSVANEVSADGSRIFWTDRDTGDLYVRENVASPAATTVQVDSAVGGGGIFLTASSDGSKVFFMKGDLYEYELGSGQTTDLTPGVEVLGLAGSSEDGAYIYYVDAGYKLNLWHDGTSVTVAALSPGDSSIMPFTNESREDGNDWQSSVGYRTAMVTPDGHSLLFMSAQGLTGYANEKLEEVFLYETGSKELTCVSCDPNGKPPVPTEYNTYKEGNPLGGFFPITKTGTFGDTYQPRGISEDGSRVFFDSAEPLVPQDINGWLDVYEWERNGTGSCRESRGCIYLLSGGTDPESSYLLGASASGNDAFVITRAHFLTQDENDNDDVYDARVGGVMPPPVPACSGSGCQGVPPAPPIFATPSSVTFNGVGNFPPPAKSVVKPKKKPKKSKQCKKGFVKKHGRCVKKSVRGRKHA